MSVRKWLAGACGVITAIAVAAVPVHAANPIITSIYTADPAPLVVGNMMYIYAGRDEAPAGTNNFVMREWHVLSSTDANTWTHHGARANIATFPWAGADAWASEVEPRNGRYYWYTSVNGNGPGWMNIGVAVGDSPLGPFTDAKGGPLISDSTPNSSGLNIDPTVFVDDDGQAYMYWGGYWVPRAVKLAANMIDTVGSVVTPQGLTNYWEAPWMFKRNGLYYMMYAANDTNGCVVNTNYACQRYATATNPLGPWTHRGIVLGQVSSTTNHAGIVELNGQSYIVYHTADAPGGGDFRRSVAVDKLNFNADGTIQRVVPTTGGGGSGGSGTNIAPGATSSTSYVSPWESLAAINNGGTPVNSQDRSSQVYGNWPQQGTQWIEYQWPSARSINRSSVYWFDDNQGIDLPASCQLQYWNGSQYVNVAGQSTCGTTAHVDNVITFNTVNTTRLRLQITARSGYSTGVLEWKAFQA
ncbi:putative glycosyl hydrolase [Actinoplanes missouriensis 431]|uniref:Putative glycosyl hydrolase n=1 Tax=Actinoplanes missouriensis (strain ATCC 14538 / DSM 43046 / CBS 188.64 / JCM 3121 / NBRC 102363 / NCIMB 12654 / NRRL B-3342 / UNCC 431) TaxID=512565 RepID=I0H868_ACTM4|nr:putative glycosyl hydrolase [Actinoplanes missouriensis 431]